MTVVAGIVGLGALGTPIAKNLLDAGYTLNVFDINSAAVESFVSLGAVRQGSPKDVAQSSEFVFTVVPNDAVLEKITFGEDGLLASTKPFIHISCSTISPDTSRKLAPLHQEKGSHYIGCPVFARADGMAKREATLAVGGDPEAVAKALPLLEATSSAVYKFGSDPGAGNVVKLCGNFMVASAIETCGEALALAEKSGLNREDVMNIFSSTIFNCLIYKGYGGRIAARQHTIGDPLVGPGFALDLGHKDILLALDTAKKAECPMPLASLLNDRFIRSRANGLASKDWSAIALTIAEDAGIRTEASELAPKRQKTA